MLAMRLNHSSSPQLKPVPCYCSHYHQYAPTYKPPFIFRFRHRNAQPIRCEHKLKRHHRLMESLRMCKRTHCQHHQISQHKRQGQQMFPPSPCEQQHYHGKYSKSRHDVFNKITTIEQLLQILAVKRLCHRWERDGKNERSKDCFSGILCKFISVRSPSSPLHIFLLLISLYLRQQ